MVIIEGIAQTHAFVSISQILFLSLSKECKLSDGLMNEKWGVRNKRVTITKQVITLIV
jgi:hypothetical protein